MPEVGWMLSRAQGVGSVCRSGKVGVQIFWPHATSMSSCGYCCCCARDDFIYFFDNLSCLGLGLGSSSSSTSSLGEGSDLLKLQSGRFV